MYNKHFIKKKLIIMLVTHQAPNFTANAIIEGNKIVENFKFQEYISKKNAVLFFWPMDFTFVCPSEIIAFNNRYEEFVKRNTKIVGVSIDSVFVHNQWKKTPINKGGIGNIKFPMVSDITREIQKKYNIIHPILGVALRASFFIDQNGFIRHQTINDLPIGRNIDEIIRIIDAWNFHKENGEVCPAQWKKGKEGISTTESDGIAKFLSKNAKNL